MDTAKASLKEQMEEITARLEQGVKEVFASGRYTEYLQLMSRFHSYSFRNSFLIFMQKPDATRVAGFTTWKNSFGRNVKKGEKGIRILAPTPHKRVVEEFRDQSGALYLDANGNPTSRRKEITVPAFKPVYVFDMSQTEGRELPTLSASTLEGKVKDYTAFLEALKNISPVPVAFEQMKTDTDGYYSLTDKKIALREGMSEVQTVVAAVHEITHATLHDPDQRDGNDKKHEEKDRRTQEVEAESVAYTVCQHYGIETAANSFAYVADWSSDKELSELQHSLNTIQKESAAIINSIDQCLNTIAKEQLIPKPEIHKESLVPNCIKPIVIDGDNYAMQLLNQYEQSDNLQQYPVFGGDEKRLIVNYAMHEPDRSKVDALAAKISSEKFELNHFHANPDIVNWVNAEIYGFPSFENLYANYVASKENDQNKGSTHESKAPALAAEKVEQEKPLSSGNFAYKLIDQYEMYGKYRTFGNQEKALLVNYAMHQSNVDEVALLASELAEAKYELTHGHIDYNVKNFVDTFCTNIDRLQEAVPIYLDAPFTPIIEILTETEGDISAAKQYCILDGDASYTIDETDRDFFPVKTIDLDSGERVTVGFSELREYTFEANAYRQHLFENNGICPGVKNLHFDGHAGMWEIIDKIGYKDDTYYAALKMGANNGTPQYLLTNQAGNVVYIPNISVNATPDHSDFIHWVNHAVAETHINRINRKVEKASIADRLAGAKESLENRIPKPTQHDKRAEMER